MSNSKLTKVASAVRGSFDRRTAGGVVIGVAFMMSAMAVAGPGDSTWFSNMFSAASSTASASSASAALITQQESPVAASIMQKKLDCINKLPGTLHDAIGKSVAAHTKIAAAGPAVETLFDINNDCFSSINKIYDLSFAIPSLASILASAQDAVLKYAEKKVCTAVNKVSAMVTDPINKAITDINSMAGFADINGMANGAIQGQMATLDPQLGAAYHPPVAAGTYTTNTNPFNTNQTTFNPGVGDQSGNINGNVNQINALMTQIGNLMIQVNQDGQAVEAAQNQVNQCDNNNWDCSSANAALQAAQQNLASHQQQLAQAEQQLATAGTSGYNSTILMAAPAQPAGMGANQMAQQAASSAAPKTFWSKVSGLFN